MNTSARWELEGVPFRAVLLAPDRTCAAPYIQQRGPPYRVWHAYGASTRCFTTQRATVAAMVAQERIDEGAAMCVLPSA